MGDESSQHETRGRTNSIYDIPPDKALPDKNVFIKSEPVDLPAFHGLSDGGDGRERSVEQRHDVYECLRSRSARGSRLLRAVGGGHFKSNSTSKHTRHTQIKREPDIVDDANLFLRTPLSTGSCMTQLSKNERRMYHEERARINARKRSDLKSKTTSKEPVARQAKRNQRNQRRSARRCENRRHKGIDQQQQEHNNSRGKTMLGIPESSLYPTGTASHVVNVEKALSRQIHEESELRNTSEHNTQNPTYDKSALEAAKMETLRDTDRMEDYARNLHPHNKCQHDECHFVGRERKREHSYAQRLRSKKVSSRGQSPFTDTHERDCRNMNVAHCLRYQGGGTNPRSLSGNHGYPHYDYDREPPHYQSEGNSRFRSGSPLNSAKYHINSSMTRSQRHRRHNPQSKSICAISKSSSLTRKLQNSRLSNLDNLNKALADWVATMSPTQNRVVGNLSFHYSPANLAPPYLKVPTTQNNSTVATRITVQGEFTLFEEQLDLENIQADSTNMTNKENGKVTDADLAILFGKQVNIDSDKTY